MTDTTVPTNFAAAGETKDKTLLSEIATRARSIDFFVFGGSLPNPDPILRKMGKDQAVYDEVLSDGHLSGVIGTRASGVKSLLWDIDRGKAKSRATKAILKAFKTMDVDQFINDVLEANYRGYSPIELMWAQPDGEGMILPEKAVGKPPEWFLFDDQGNLKFRTVDAPLGIDLPPRKFLLPRRKASYKNPYGEPLLSKCYWPAVFKRNGLKFWVTFVEKYGIPYAVGKLPRGAGEQEYEKLADMLDAMIRDAVAVIPDDASVEILEPAGKAASSAIFADLVAWADSEMSKVIIGHAAGADSTPGKLGGEDQAQEVKAYLVEEDKRLVENAANQLIKWIFEINFGEGELPVFSMYEEEDVDLDLATRDKSLSDQGVELSKDYYTRAYGFEEGDIVAVNKPKESAPVTAKGKLGANFAETRKGPIAPPDQAAIDEFADGLDPKEMQAQAEGFLKPVIDLINRGKSFEEILDNLAATFEDMDSQSLEKMLQRAIFVSEIIGRENAD